MTPSARALAVGGLVEIDVSKLEPGQMISEAWRGMTIRVLRRTSNMLERLLDNAPLLVDPASAVATQQPFHRVGLPGVDRALHPSGCVPLARLVSGPAADLGDN